MYTSKLFVIDIRNPTKSFYASELSCSIGIWLLGKRLSHYDFLLTDGLGSKKRKLITGCSIPSDVVEIDEFFKKQIGEFLYG